MQAAGRQAAGVELTGGDTVAVLTKGARSCTSIREVCPPLIAALHNLLLVFPDWFVCVVLALLVAM